MTYHILFWAFCAVLAALALVAVISIVKAYRRERWPYSKPTFMTGRERRNIFLN